MLYKYFKSFILTACLIIPGIITGTDNGVLELYIKHGLKSNLALEQKRENYKLNYEILKEARGMFYPSMSFNMRYSVARGGRVIEFPVGDLLNPVYSTLNLLTERQDFPTIENETFRFYRPREHETKVRVVQPVIHPEIWYNRRIREHEKDIGHIDVDIYKRSLVAEIKEAYFNYLKSLQIEQIIENTIILLKENVRVSEKLAENNMVTQDNIFRSRAELSNAEQQLAEASGSSNIAAAWFNFLINRDLEDEIEIDETILKDQLTTKDSDNRFNTSGREELEKANRMVLIAEDYIDLKRSGRLPSVTAVVEYGFQGTTYSFGKDDDFVLASLVLSWPLFEGFRNNAGIQQAKVKKEMMELIYQEIQQKMNLEVINSWYKLEAADKAVDASVSRVNSSKVAFRLIERMYEEGQATLIEYIDARTNMTNSKLNLVISKYDYYISYAGYEKSAALYRF